MVSELPSVENLSFISDCPIGLIPLLGLKPLKFRFWPSVSWMFLTLIVPPTIFAVKGPGLSFENIFIWGGSSEALSSFIPLLDNTAFLPNRPVLYLYVSTSALTSPVGESAFPPSFVSVCVFTW